VAQLAAHPTC